MIATRTLLAAPAGVLLLLLLCAAASSSSFSRLHEASVEDVEQEFAESLGVDTLGVENYITDISFAVGSDKGVTCSDGFTKDWTDLNQKAGGKFIFMCYKKEAGKTPITDIKVVNSGSKLYGDSCPGYQFIDTDLNQGAGGDFVHFCIKKGSGSPVTDIKFVTGQNAYQSQCSGFTAVSTDLNKGSGGEYVYLCFKKDSNAIDKVRMFDVVYDMSKLTESDNNVKTVNKITIDNNDKTDSQAQALIGSWSVSESKSYSISNSAMVGMSLQVTAGSPLIGNTNIWTVSASYTFTGTNGESTTTTETRDYQFSCAAAAYTQTECDAVYRTAKVTVPYTAKAEYTYLDGRKETQTVSGVYTGVSASSFYMTKTVLKEYDAPVSGSSGGGSGNSAPASEGLTVLQLLDTLQSDIENMRAVIACSDTLFGSNCYKVVNKQLPYSSADTFCEGWGGKVATIHNKAENDFIAKSCAGKYAWIGLKRDSAGKFTKWVDGTNMDYQNWAPGEPNNWGSGEDTGHMRPDGLWNDIPAGDTGTTCFVCKK